jgi:hypothetical protein
LRAFDIICFFLIIFAAFLFISAWPFDIGKQIDLKEAFSTLAAAFAGAYGAQIILEKNKNEERIIREIRNINASIALALTICNHVCSFKKQYVCELKENFSKNRSIVMQALDYRTPNESSKPQRIRADIQIFQQLSLPTKVLQEKIFGELSVQGRIPVLVTMLVNSIEVLNGSIKLRNEWIKSFRSSAHLPGAMEFLYFGLPDQNGQTDTTYACLIDGIFAQTNDSIYYSKILCEDLSKYGEKVRVELGQKAPKVSKFDFTKIERGSIFPSQDDYADWHRAFEHASY